MIVGEPQILGQVKEAYVAARAAGALNSGLEPLLQRAFAVAKRVRSETSIGASAVSVASAAVALAREIFGTLEGKQVFLVGAGKMSELAARHLMAHGAGSVVVANRTHAKAVQLAEQFGGEAIHFEDLYERADRADIVITSTGAPHAIFRREHGQRFLQRRRNRPMFFIDIAVPRDVAAEMGELDGIFVYNIDDLQSVVESNLSARSEEAQRAEAIIEEELHRFAAHERVRELAPTITSLQEYLEGIRRSELQRIRGRLGELTPGQELALESLTHGIINKVLHMPVSALKSAARESQSAAVIQAVQKIFNLPSEPRSAAAKADHDSASETGAQVTAPKE
jgi:glutamyl-tRNA reductase